MKAIIASLFIIFSANCFAGITIKWDVVHNPKHKKDKTEMTYVSKLMTEVPTLVLQEFYNSFISDTEGYFLGAMINDIRNYISLEEIITLIEGQGFAVDDTKIIDRHRPRITQNGCKYNVNWLCQFKDFE